MTKKDCKDCDYLKEYEGGQWLCEEKGLPIDEVGYCAERPLAEVLKNLETKSAIKRGVYNAFADYFSGGDLFELVHSIAMIADYSVRFNWQATLLFEAIEEVKQILKK